MVFTNSVFLNNTALREAAIYIGRFSYESENDDPDFESTLTFTDCQFVGNSASLGIGGLIVIEDPYKVVTIENGRFVDNYLMNHQNDSQLASFSRGGILFIGSAKEVRIKDTEFKPFSASVIQNLTQDYEGELGSNIFLLLFAQGDNV